LATPALRLADMAVIWLVYFDLAYRDYG